MRNMHLTPLKAIRAKCLDCSYNQPKEVKLCPIPDCPLFPYRYGHNPARKGHGPGIALLGPKAGVVSANPTNTEVLNESGAV